MRIAIAGAGSVGSVIAAYLAQAGHEVSLLVRGAHLQAIKAEGLTVLTRGQRLTSRPAASDRPGDLGQHDLVIAAAKAHSLPAMAPAVAALRKPGAPVIAAQNGVPWWYFHGLHIEGAGESLSNKPFARVDPGGVIWEVIGPQQTIGCVINMATEVTAPGVVTHEGPLRLTLGAPDVKAPPVGLPAIAETLKTTGIDIVLSEDIRRVVWGKLQLNLASGPCAVLTGATLGQIRQGENMMPLLIRIMRETSETAAALGVEIPAVPGDWLARGGGATGHKPSMLQDFEAGRPLELDAIVAAVVDLAELMNIPVPTIEGILAMLRLKIACRDAQHG